MHSTTLSACGRDSRTHSPQLGFGSLVTVAWLSGLLDPYKRDEVVPHRVHGAITDFFCMLEARVTFTASTDFAPLGSSAQTTGAAAAVKRDV